MQLTLKQSVEMLKADVDCFEKFYENGMKTTDYFHEELSAGEWLEQFIVYLESETNDE